MTDTELAGKTFDTIAEAVASDAATPGGGAVAGLTAALAAGLVAMVARYSTATDRFDPVTLAARADELRGTAQRLADEDARVYRRYLDAAALPKQPDPAARKAAIRAALDAAADVPLALTEVAEEVAGLGELLAGAGNPRLRSDAVTAAQLGGAVATSAAALVEENLRARTDDPRVVRAAALAASARTAAAGLLEPTRPEPTPPRSVPS
ncbi:cyclodeaminase/cyclohydrolase family protein [Amycolatopsis rhabdoformis]|uniref:Cyclodeaminase/cyclohydrolase family protein n=1 Tax=Amycolatopsis rhabdoformis TaxID=1448059 RepID=A0ABZ1I6E8_9PSEU|nr:cyclodeaminase/cyclohydrolase family protein [Amycolatopsis rhabdoformis]WSE29922.1 cyclodeaminase/cyclohydrolase family protein [Amycolatopsis rhabdoformis]